MEAKWPFMLITFGLIFALGLTIAGLERNTVINNWTSRRCELPVVAAARFFKPASDPRTPSQFASDNFDFCMKTYVDKFINLFMAPINAIFGKQTFAASGALDMVNTIRDLAQKLYTAFLTYLEQYYRRFNASVFEMSRIVQYLRMAFRRANAMVISMLYTGITMFRGMINTIQFVIQVILIVCGIMLAIIIILIFILFPVIPLILAVLGAIVATVLAMIMVMSGELANQANSDKSGFCLSKDSKIAMSESASKSASKSMSKSASDIKIGDELGSECGRVTAIVKMDGNGVQLYSINGIHVSGSHLVLGTDGVWKSVSADERAVPIKDTSDTLYCFNTTTHRIPVYAASGSQPILLFRDWEELADNDSLGHYTWTYTILKLLNNNSSYSKWKSGLTPAVDVPLMGHNVRVKTTAGFVRLSTIDMSTTELVDGKGNRQRVLGVIEGEVEGVNVDEEDWWHTELYELSGEVWVKGQRTVKEGEKRVCGKTVITETGELVIWDECSKTEKTVRDFTEIGHKDIHKTYPLIASRLRLINS